MSTHQAVINVMDAARRAGLSRMTFAAQTGTGAAARPDARARRAARRAAGATRPHACRVRPTPAAPLVAPPASRR